MSKIGVGAWRKDKAGPLQVLSGPIGRQKVHYQAPAAARVDAEMRAFLHWFNGEKHTDLVRKAGIAHLWLVTIHPLGDGNGRSEDSAQRFYSMSAQIRKERNEYYRLLEATQKGDLNIAPWMEWFLACLDRAFEGADTVLAATLVKARFWERYRTAPLNERQRTMVKKLLDGFEGKLTSAQRQSERVGQKLGIAGDKGGGVTFSSGKTTKVSDPDALFTNFTPRSISVSTPIYTIARAYNDSNPIDGDAKRHLRRDAARQQGFGRDDPRPADRMTIKSAMRQLRGRYRATRAEPSATRSTA